MAFPILFAPLDKHMKFIPRQRTDNNAMAVSHELANYLRGTVRKISLDGKNRFCGAIGVGFRFKGIIAPRLAGQFIHLFDIPFHDMNQGVKFPLKRTVPALRNPIMFKFIHIAYSTITVLAQAIPPFGDPQNIFLTTHSMTVSLLWLSSMTNPLCRVAFGIP